MHTKPEIQTYYNRFHQRKRLLNEYNVNKRLTLAVEVFLKDYAGNIALDIGCGPGRLTDTLLKKFSYVVGMDISQDSVKFAYKNSRIKEKCDFVVADTSYLPFKKGCFDTIVMSEVLEHLYCQKQVLKEIKKLLKYQGYLILTTPNRVYRDIHHLIYTLAQKSKFGQIIENQLYPAELRILVRNFFIIQKEKGVFFSLPFIDFEIFLYYFNNTFLLSIRNWFSEFLENRDLLPRLAQHQCLVCSPRYNSV